FLRCGANVVGERLRPGGAIALGARFVVHERLLRKRLILGGRARLVREPFRGSLHFLLRLGSVIYETLRLTGILLLDYVVVVEHGGRRLVLRRAARDLLTGRGCSDRRRLGLGEL